MVVHMTAAAGATAAPSPDPVTPPQAAYRARRSRHMGRGIRSTAASPVLSPSGRQG